MAAFEPWYEQGLASPKTAPLTLGSRFHKTYGKDYGIQVVHDADAFGWELPELPRSGCKPIRYVLREGDGQQPRMRTRTVRIYERDVDRIREIAGLGDAGPFATATQVVVDQASKHGPAAAEDVREIVREELDRRLA